MELDRARAFAAGSVDLKCAGTFVHGMPTARCMISIRQRNTWASRLSRRGQDDYQSGTADSRSFHTSDEEYVSVTGQQENTREGVLTELGDM